MNVGNLQAGSGRLQEALEELQRAWSETTEVWKDANARNFDEQYLRTIAEEINVAIPAISHLAQVLQTAHRELEE
jgi:uncharacterized protein YukE